MSIKSSIQTLINTFFPPKFGSWGHWFSGALTLCDHHCVNRARASKQSRPCFSNWKYLEELEKRDDKNSIATTIPANDLSAYHEVILIDYPKVDWVATSLSVGQLPLFHGSTTWLFCVWRQFGSRLNALARHSLVCSQWRPEWEKDSNSWFSQRYPPNRPFGPRGHEVHTNVRALQRTLSNYRS